MAQIEVEEKHAPIVQKFIQKMAGIQNGTIKIIFRDGNDERIDREEWELTRPKQRRTTAA